MAQDIFEQLHAAVKQAESQGKRFDEKGNLLTSPKGAQGEMQVMPKTARDPGYGVVPAQGKHPDELARVGKDYLKAMVDKYGDTQKALIAYNWGPKNTDDWLAKGADPKILPAETKNYVGKISKALGGDKVAPLPDSGPTESEKMMTNALRTGMSAENMVKDAGPGYKAAMAMMFLADDKPETDQNDIWKEAEADQAAQTEDITPESPLASLDLAYKSPFQQKPIQPVAHLAAGGLPAAPKVGVKGTAREALDAIKAEYDQYAKDADTYNTALADYKTTTYDPYVAEVGKYNTALDDYKTKVYNPYAEKVTAYNSSLDKYKQDLYNPYLSEVEKYNNALAAYKTDTYDPYLANVGTYNTALEKYNTDVYTPYSTALDAYNKAAEEWNAGPRTTAFAQTAPTLAKTFDMTAPTAPAAFAGTVPTAPTAFADTAPTAPDAFAVTAPTLAKTFDKTAPTTPKTSQEEYDKMVAASRQDVVNRQQALDVASNPEAYGLTLNKLFSHGGAVHRADGSPEYGEIPTGGITEDTRTAMATPITARGALNALKEVGMDVGRGALSNAESLVRGAVSQVPGTFGDLEALARKGINFSFGPGGVKVDEKTYAPTSEEIRASVPRMTPARQESAGMESMGEVMAPGLAKAAAPVTKAVGKEAARQMLRGMEGEGPLTSISPPILYAREPGKAAPGPIYSHLPSSEAPFVGRLDEYVASLPGPVQKQQFFGQLKGKFRDYEIGRAEEALKDLPDNAKLTPSDLLNRVKEVYDPSRYKTTVLPPNPEASSINNRWRSMDNIFYNKETDEGAHLGVIHLNKDVPPEVAQRQMAANDAVRAVKHMSNDWSVARYPEKMDELENFLKTSGVQLQPDLAKKLDTGVAQYRKIASYEEDMKAAKDKLMYPNLDPQYDILHEKYAAQLRETDPTMPNYVARTKTEPFVVKELADQANAWLAKNGYKPVKLPDYSGMTNPSMHAMTDSPMGMSIQEAFHPVKEQIGMADRNLAKHMKGAEDEFKKTIGHELPYMGQHESLGGGPAQISFSRYSEHTADVPGMGPTQGIYVHELQSDMLDDLRKLGPKRGSAIKDTEEYNDIVEKLKSLEKSREEAYRAGNNKMVEELDNQLVSAGGRADVLSKRLSGYKTNYSMDEAFHKMESSAKTTQQLMAKNAISGAIQQGKNFVAFPGVESAQAKLYEKLPRNLKDVVKDLGPGFEIRPVELSGPMGKSMHTAVVWGPEAAARIQKKGVPFATGGLVDSSNIDHRKYL